MIKSYKIMLLPNDKQRTRLFQFAGTARFAYNWALDREMEAFEDGEKFISSGDLRKEFTVLRNSEEYKWLQTISNNVTKQAIKDCCEAYSRFFERQKRVNVKYTKKKLAHLERIGKKPTVYDMNGHQRVVEVERVDKKEAQGEAIGIDFQTEVFIRISTRHQPSGS